jgi:hypothetical protein
METIKAVETVNDQIINRSELVIAGYKVDQYGVLRGAPCGCDQCSVEGWQRGHLYCDDVPAELLALEEQGAIRRNLDSSWYWEVNS